MTNKKDEGNKENSPPKFTPKIITNSKPKKFSSKVPVAGFGKCDTTLNPPKQQK